MTTLPEFVLARNAEREAVARAAYGVPWEIIDGVNASQILVDPTAIRDEKWRVGHLGHVAMVEHSTDAAHIALNDPAHVLAWCETVRRIVKEHSAHPEPQRMVYGTIVACSTCGDVDDNPTKWPCDTLRILALPDVGHPDYDPAWAV